MAIANSYPVGTIKTEDLILGTSIPLAGTNDKPVTKNFSVASFLALGSPPNILTAEVLVTDAQLRTLGTTRVDILPKPGDGYAYQILGLTTQSSSTGAPTSEFYDWGTQDAVFSWRSSAPLVSEHRVIIPNGQLPVGGGLLNAGIYVGTPIAGGSRDDSAIKLGVTSDTNPIIAAGEDPNATWRIDVTYRLIKES
jgi:hypothetical protein